MMRLMRTLLIVSLLLLTTCRPAGETSRQVPTTAPTATATAAPTVDASVEPAPVPPYVLGLSSVRLGVMGSIADAKAQQADLVHLIGGAGWLPEVWRDEGNDPAIAARVQVSDVDPLAAAQLCAWLVDHGWHSGLLPCGPLTTL